MGKTAGGILNVAVFAVAALAATGAASAADGNVRTAGETPQEEMAWVTNAVAYILPQVVYYLDGREASEAPIPEVRILVVRDAAGGLSAPSSDPAKREIRMGAAWAAERPRGEVCAVLAQETVHVVQNYCTNAPPCWVSDGIASWVRWFMFSTPEERVPMMEGIARCRRPDESPFAAAAFLDWAGTERAPDVVERLNKACREGRYDGDRTWAEILGKPLDALSAEWRKSRGVDDGPGAEGEGAKAGI